MSRLFTSLILRVARAPRVAAVCPALLLVVLLMVLAAVTGAAAAQTTETTTLSGITVDGDAIPDFDAERDSYTVGLANGVAAATVVATPTASSATVTCSTDTDVNAAGCQVALTAGQGVDLTLTVTNDSATMDYTLTLNRGLTGAFAWKASDDIYGLDTTPREFTNPRGTWSDGTTLWVANIDGRDSKLVAFNLETKARQSLNDINTGASDVLHVRRPVGVAGTDDGSVLVARRHGGSFEPARIQGFRRNDASEWQPEPDELYVLPFEIIGATSIRGIWTHGERLYIADDSSGSDNAVLAFTWNSDRSDIAHDSPGGITLASENDSPAGIWSDGETIWVADAMTVRIFAYKTVDGQRDTAKEFTQDHLTVKEAPINPWGIWSDGETMWVVGRYTAIVYSFNLPASNNPGLSQLEVQHGEDPVELSVAETTHTVVLPGSPTSTTLTIAPRNRFATVDVLPADANLSLGGYQVDLTGGPVEVTITVTAADATTRQVYTVTVGPAPLEITSVIATPNTRLLQVSWHEPSNSATLGVTAYDLRYARTDADNLENDDQWAVIDDVWTTGGGDLSYILRGLTNGQAYYVQVRAVNALREGPWPPHERISESATGTPAASTSLDTSLSAITVNGAAIPNVAMDRGNYTVGVARSVATATVIGTPRDVGAIVSCIDDSDPEADGCQASLTENGSTEVQLTVTTGTTVGNYTITINRGRGGTFHWKASQDIYGLYASSTTSFPRGIWSDGTTLWVVNNGIPKGLFAFDLESGARQPQADIVQTLAETQASLRGLAGADGMIFVADSRPTNALRYTKVFAYTQGSSGDWQHNPPLDLTGSSVGLLDTNTIQGIWTDGEVLWGSVGGAIRAVWLTGPSRNQRLPARDFGIASLSQFRGLWSDGETMWAAESSEIRAYDMLTRAHVASKSFDSDHLRVPGSTVDPWGIWSDGETMWAVDSVEGNAYSFEMPVSNNATLQHLRIDGVDAAEFDRELSSQTLGLANDASTITLDARPRHFQAEYLITSTDDDSMEGHQIDVSGAAKTFTATVTAQDAVTTKTYSIEIGRLPALIVGADATPGPNSLSVGWSAPSDPGSSAVTSYDLRYAATQTERLHEDSRWTEVPGVWQTGGGTRSHQISGLDPRDEYYVQVRANNGVGSGPWMPHSRIGESGRGTPQASGSDVSSLSSLSVSPGALSPGFGTGTTGYSVELGFSVERITVAAATTDSNADYEILGGSEQTTLVDADPNTSGFQVDVPAGAYTITVSVTSQNLLESTDYTISITRAAAATDANLSVLSLNDADLDELLDFDTATTSYTFAVPNDSARITVTATARSARATVAFLKGASGTDELADADPRANGFQIDLIGGQQKTFRVVVTAESGTERTYTLRVTRSQPRVGVEVVPPLDGDANEIPYVEGDSLNFTVSLGSALSSDVDVAYTLTGDIVAGATSGTARIVAGQTSVDVTVPTSGNTLYSDHHTVTLTLTAPGDGAYAFVTNKQSVAVEVRDDDFPDISNAVADMEVDGTSVVEGGTVTVTVRIELDSLTDFPHASSTPVRLYTADRPANTPGDKATAGDDYQALDVQVSIPPENFEIGNGFLGPTIVGTATLEIPILFDPEAEAAEKFDVHLSDSRFAYAFVVTEKQTITIAANAAASTEAALGSLSASPAALTPDFAPTTYSYAGSVASTVTQVTLAAAPSDPDAHLVEYLDDNNDAIVDADGNEGNGLQAALAVDDNVFTVRVTAEDRATTQDYTVTITRRLSDVATLSALTIRDSAATGTFTQSFSTNCNTCTHTARVDGDVEQLTITPTPTDQDASVSYHRGDTELSDADTATADTFEVDLAEGDNVIEVRVTAGDGTTTKSHTLTVTRASDKPVASVRAPTGTPVEGATLAFAVRLSRAAEADITIGLSATQTGTMIVAKPPSVTIAAGDTSATAEVTTQADLIWEEHSEITLEIDASTNDDYTVSGSAGSATKTVQDDDFPLGDAVLALTADTVDEGTSVTATVTVTTRGDEQPHTASGHMVIATEDGVGSGGAVSPADFTAVTARRFNLPMNRFTQVDVDDDPVAEDPRWRAAYELTINTVNDANPEVAETFDVLLRTDSTSEHADKLSVSGSPATATIRTSDFAEVGISSTKSDSTEGASISYTVTRSGPVATADIVVNLAVEEDGDMLSASDEGERTATIPANQSSTTFTLPTQTDTIYEEHSTITVTVVDGGGYTHREATGRATDVIDDDDFPAAQATLAVSAPQLDEGDTLTLTYTVTTDANEIPHRGTGLLRVAAASGTATAGLDFAGLDEQLDFEVDDFEEVDVDDTVSGEDLRQQATKEWEILITDDNSGERAETFTVSLRSISGGSNPTAANIDIAPSDPAELTVAIGPSDLPIISITTDTATVVEGNAIEYTVARSFATTEALMVTVVVTETSTLAAAGETGDRTVTIGAGRPSATLIVATSTDTEWDEHGTVTAVVVAGDGYTVSDSRRAATRNVEDNDFPEASLSLQNSPATVWEGFDQSLGYLFLTADDHQPHKSTGEFILSILGGTAVVGPRGDGVDVIEFEPLVFSVDAGSFTRVDLDLGPGFDWRWSASTITSRRLNVVDDIDEEALEQFSLNLVAAIMVDSSNPADGNIMVTSPGVIQISANDIDLRSEDATLSGLDLRTDNSIPALSPGFVGNQLEYTATVAFAETELTITPTTNDMNASVTYREGTIGSLTAVTGGSFQVNLAEGPNVIEIHVAAHDPRYTETYTVAVTRQPQVSIAVKTTGAVTEGGPVEFTVTRSRASDADLVVNLTVTDVGDVIDPDGEGAKQVTIPADQRSADYTVTTRGNTAYAARAEVTVAVTGGDGYTPATTGGSASKDIRDDDFPGAEITLTVDKNTAAEGESVTATVTVQVSSADILHAGVDAGVIVLRASDTASSTPGTDYSFTEMELPFNYGDFSPEDIDPGNPQDFRSTARRTVTIRITDDNVTEGDEDLTLLLVRPDRQQQPDALHPNIRLGTATATVTIPANDSADATLSALALTDGTDSIGHLDPAFRTSVTEYRAGVGFDTTSVTLAATAHHEEARVSIAGRAQRDRTSSETLNLRVGENVLTVVVTAENDTTTQTYTVRVTRAPQVTSLTPTASDPAAAYATTATYDIVFRGHWNQQVTPPRVPANAHFTALVGGVHGDAVSFLTAGGQATAGVEAMAETGATQGLQAEVQIAMDAADPTAYGTFRQTVGGGPTAVATLNEIVFTSEFPRLTLTSMIAPTPDWFVGVSGLPMLDNQGRWLRERTVNLYPWDAGTEDDVSDDNGFSQGGLDTDPQENIRSLRGAGPFTIERIASLEVTLHSVATMRELDENTGAGVNIGAAVASPAAPPAGSGTITYSLAGADAGSFEINTTTGQLRAKSGLDYDFEARSGNSYALTVVATDAGPDPEVVTNIDVTIILRNVEEAGELAVAPAAAGVNVLLTASLSDPDGGVTDETWTWERSDNGVSGWSAIANADTATYTPVADDEAKYLRVTVTYDDAQGMGRSLSQVLGPVEAPAQLSDDSTLSALSLSGLTLNQSFSSSVTTYTAAADYTTVQTTVTATAGAAADGAAVQILDGNGDAIPDADDRTGGHQVALTIDVNVIVAKVTAEDGSSQSYTVTVTRAQPTVTVTAPAATLTEGSTVPFVVSRSEAAGDGLAVKVEVSEVGEMVAAANETVHTVTIPADAQSLRLEIASVSDESWEAHAVVTAAVQADASYTVGSPGSAEQTVSDNDFPDAEAVLEVTDEVDEGGSATATVTITTAGDHMPHEDSGPILASTQTGSAGGGDFTALTAMTGTLEFAADDFVAGNGDNGCPTGTYCLSQSVDIAITDDDLAENAETFTVAMARVNPANPSEARTDGAITLDGTSTPQTVTIRPSDRSSVNTLGSLSLDGTVLTAASDGSYAATVNFADEQVTVVAAAGDNTATVSFLDQNDAELDDASTIPGHQVDVVIGETVFKVLVTAQDTTAATYTVTATRSGPVLTLSVTAGDLTEGDDVVFTVSRNGTTSDATAFELTVIETGGEMATAGLSTSPLSLSIGSGQNSVTHTVPTEGDDNWEPHAQITAAATSAYRFENDTNSITKEVLDDDFPAAEAVLTVSPTTIAERDGATVTATLTVTTDANEQPHKASGTIRLATAPNTANTSDYQAISSTAGAVSFDAADFAEVDIGGGVMRWQASRAVQIGIVDDAIKEPQEQFSVTMAVTTGSRPTDAHIRLHADAEFVVSIDPSDRSSDASLQSLGLSAGRLDTAFQSGTIAHTVTVPFGSPRITVSPQATDSNAVSVEVLDGTDQTAEVDVDPNTPGTQVDLELNTPRAIAITVTAEDTTTMRTYTLTITRQLPELTISVTDDELAEGESVVATISRDAATDETTAFTLSVSEDGTMVDDVLETDGVTYLIQAEQTAFELEIPTQADDVWDAASTVSVELEENDAAYRTSGPLTVTAAVSDNDFPEAAAVLAVSSDTVDESQTVTATVTITTVRAEQPNEDGGKLLVSTSDGPDPDGAGNGAPATAGIDYRALTATTGELTFRQQEFVEGDETNDCPVSRWCASKNIEIATLDDNESEQVERFTLSLAAVTTDPDPTDSNIALDPDRSSQHVDIAPNDLTDKAGLQAIELTGGELSPTFISTTTEYTASIGFDHPRTTIAPETLNPGETFDFYGQEGLTLLDDADITAPGFQVDLPVGTAVVVRIVATARDQLTIETYTVTFTRQVPEVAIGVPQTSGLEEGAELTFTVTLNGPVEATAGLDVTLTIDETGGMLPPPNDSPRSVTVNVPQGRTTATHTLATVDDDAWEEHSTISVSVSPTPGSYTVPSSSEAASHIVMDDDFPEATAVLEVSPRQVDEGGTVTAAVVMTTARDEQPREDGGTILLSTTDGTATAGDDYTAISPASGALTFAQADFKRVDIDSNPGDNVTDYRWRAAKAATISVANDTADEPDETFSVAMAADATGSSPTDGAITLDSSTSSLDVTINASDVHRVARVTVRSPSQTGATATVSITNPNRASVTVYLRYRPDGGAYEPAVEMQTSRASVQFELSGLSEATLYEVQASLDDGFASPKTARFSTLGSAPSVSELEVENAGQTGASVTAFIANVGTTTAGTSARSLGDRTVMALTAKTQPVGAPTVGARTIRAPTVQTQQPEHTVRLRYRYEGEPWSQEQSMTTTASSVTFHLTGLRASATPEVEATLSDSFDDVGVQSLQFDTEPPAVTAVDAADITAHTATITVTVSDRNGDQVHLRYRADDHWTQVSKVFDEGGTDDTFELPVLVAGTAYNVEASFDSTFIDRAATRCMSFVTDTAPDSDDGRQTGANCRGSADTPGNVGGGGPAPGGGGGLPPGGEPEPETAQPDVVFSDVPQDAWYHDAVQHIARLGITTGCLTEPLRYCPAQPVSRAQMAAFLSRLLGGPPADTAPDVVFSDVPQDAWYHDAVQHIARLGITTGCLTEPLRYCPAQPVSRAQMAAFLSRLLGGPPADTAPDVVFSDVPQDAWYHDAVQHIARLGITTGCLTEPLRYCPAQPVSRAQMAAFLSRAITHSEARDDNAAAT